MELSEFKRAASAVKFLSGDARRAEIERLKSVRVTENGQPVEIVLDVLEDSEPTTKAFGRKTDWIPTMPTSTSTLPFGAKSTGPLANFSGPDARERAFTVGAWFLSLTGKSQAASNWCADRGIVAKTHSEGTNSTGGYLVPEQVSDEIIRLVAEYGVARRLFKTWPMNSDQLRIPRREGGLTANWVAEGAAGTASTGTWGAVSLNTKKLMSLTMLTTELNEDAVLSIGDLIGAEMALAIATAEDAAAFNGDGTSTYSGIQGVRSRLVTINDVDDGGGIVLASGNAWSEITLPDLRRVVARTPSYARKGAAWVVSPSFFDGVMQKLLDAVGGATVASIVDMREPRFFGYPVFLSETMPSTEANSQVCALFGNFNQACAFGDRRQLTMTTTNSGVVDNVDLFARDLLAMKATERIDIVVHDVGTATVAGPVVGLVTAGS